MSQNPGGPQSPIPNVGGATRAQGAHDEPGDHEEIYYAGSPLVRGRLGLIVLWALVGLLFLAAPFLYRHFERNNQWPAWWITVACVILGLICLSIPLIIVKSVRYRISNYRIDFERGILGKKIDTLELWHVEDIRFDQSFLDRILGVGNIIVISHDDTTPKLPMYGLPNPRQLFETLKQRVIAVKRQRGVVKMDIGGVGGDIGSA